MPNVNDIIERICILGDYRTYQSQNTVLEVFGYAFKIEINLIIFVAMFGITLCSLPVQHLLQWKDVLQMWVSESHFIVQSPKQSSTVSLSRFGV